MNPPSRDSSGQSGFTLLEIAIVIFIMGLMLTLIAPNIAGLHDARLKSEVRRLAGRSAYLYDRASATKLVLRLTFDLDSNRYFVSRLDPFAVTPVFVPDFDPGSSPVMLPDGVRIRDVAVAGTGLLAKGIVNTNYYPEGWVDATVIHLMNDYGQVFTLKFNPLTGRTTIRRGDVPFKAALAMVN
jgi:prepilin-type N-terminal cleavage/methylation domain-containing protein